MTLDAQWFSEPHQDTAFSLRIRERLHAEQTPFQFIEIYDTVGFGKLMVIDGCVMLTDRDNFVYHEMMSHPVLFSHPRPERVLIIGGGDCGTLREVLKHGCVREATQVDIDERVTRLAERYFPQLCDANGDPRARLLFDDGIAHVKQTAPGSLDVIIIDSTDPVGPAEGLFSTAFYRDCLHALGPQGLLVQQSESPLLHAESIIRPMHDSLRAAGFSDTHTLHFPQASYPSGWWTATLAAATGTIGFAREAEAAQPGFATEYYTAEIHRAAQATPAFLRRVLAR
jgi:spermidine synthase